MTKNEMKSRMDFLSKYEEFDKWLLSIGYVSGKIGSIQAYHYSVYDNHIDSLYSVEYYVNDILRTEISFIRDRTEHKFIIVGEMGSFSEPISIDEMKTFITAVTLKEKNNLLHKLESIIL